MFGSQILEVAIGVIFIFILVSILCTVVREVLEGLLKSRAAFLEHGIRELLHDQNGQGLSRSIYRHPLIYSLYSGEPPAPSRFKRPGALANGGTLPSYIPTKNFALALMDLAARGLHTTADSSGPQSPPVSVASIRENIANLKNPDVQRVVLMAVDSAQGDLAQAQANLEAWYDSGMDRVSGWYKRKSQWIIFWIGLFVAIVLNINTITIAHYLSHNDVARAALVARAETAAKDATFVNRDYRAVKSELDSLALPVGWAGWGAPWPGKQGPSVWNDFLGPVFGWLVTALAAMLGAPFWFDTLNRVMVIRSTVKPHEKSQEEASEDRQQPVPAPILPVAAPHAVAPPVAVAALPPPPVAADAAPPAPMAAPPADPTSHLDGCDVQANDFTPDEALPAAVGGVAQPALL